MIGEESGDLMIKKFNFLLFIVIGIFLFVGLDNVLADCSDCSTSNCEACGCVLGKNKTSCVYTNVSSSTKSCGNKLLTNIPSSVPSTVKTIYTIIQIAIPVLLVIMGSLDLFKGLTAGKEDEIKKGQQMFIKRLITAAIIFFVFVIVKFVISIFAKDDQDSKKAQRIIDCAECFIKNKCD